MFKRFFVALLFEIAACALVALCMAFITTLNTSFPLEAATPIGVTGLILWSALTTYAILYAADLTST